MSEDNNPKSSKKVVTYDAQKIIGQGSFGAVFLTRVVETDEIVAIKKVLQDRRFKNRELQIMRQLKKHPHPYVVQLKHYFSSKGSNSEDVYLNLVLEYVPETLYSVNRYYTKRKELMPSIFIKIYTYQMLRALAHIHGMGIAHRDIKPQNLLVDPLRHTLKLCDFGSAKALVAGEPNVAYICSRFYRAPELIIGGNEYIPYSPAIDVWSAGCVLCELLLGTPIFPGISAPDQIIEIVKILGTPSDEDLVKINVAKNELKIPRFHARPLDSVFKNSTPDILELVRETLTYVPSDRVSAIAACALSSFDELRDANTVLPDGSPLSELMWQFSAEELSMASPEVVAKLCPSQANASDSSNGQSSNGLTDMMKAATIVGRSEATTAENSSNSLMVASTVAALNNNSPQKAHNVSSSNLA